MPINRRVVLFLLVALVLGSLAPGSTRVSALGRLDSPPAKKKCVIKKVHGKKKKVCTKVKSKPTPTPTPTPVPQPLIDASGYVWVDGAGNPYVSSGQGSNGRVAKLSSTGARLATYHSDLDGAAGVAVDAQGNVYVADIGGDQIVKFSSSGNVLARLGPPGGSSGGLSAPEGIGLDGAGNVYVADSNNARIQAYTPTNQVFGTWGSYGADPGQLEHPLDVAIDGRGDLFVDDYDNNRVEEFAPSGTLVGLWGSEGSGAGQFEHPKGIALDAAGNVYVADTGNRRVQKFSSDGTPLVQWSTGDYEPVSPGTDAAGNVYVTEDLPGGTAGYGVAKYAPDGRLLSVWR